MELGIEADVDLKSSMGRPVARGGGAGAWVPTPVI